MIIISKQLSEDCSCSPVPVCADLLLDVNEFGLFFFFFCLKNLYSIDWIQNFSSNLPGGEGGREIALPYPPQTTLCKINVRQDLSASSLQNSKIFLLFARLGLGFLLF